MKSYEKKEEINKKGSTSVTCAFQAQQPYTFYTFLGLLYIQAMKPI